MSHCFASYDISLPNIYENTESKYADASIIRTVCIQPVTFLHIFASALSDIITLGMNKRDDMGWQCPAQMS